MMRLEFNGLLTDPGAPVGANGPARRARDRDVVRSAWARWGVDCAAHLQGEFSFSLVDEKGETAYAAQDHLASHPLFYAVIEGRLKLSSTIRAVYEMITPRPALCANWAAINLSNVLPYFAPDTAFAPIKRLMPGHWLLWRDGQLTVRRYWNPHSLPQIRLTDPQAYVARGRELLSRAVRARIMPDERLGVHVSGGLDSSAIAAIAAGFTRNAGMPDPIGLAWDAVGADRPGSNPESLVDIMRADLGFDLAIADISDDTIHDVFGIDPALDYDARILGHEAPTQRAARARSVDTVLSGWGGDQGLTYNGAGLAFHALARGKIKTLNGFYPGKGRLALPAALRTAWHERQGQPAVWTPRGYAAQPRPVNVIRRPHRNPQTFQRAIFAASALSSRIESWAISGRAMGLTYRYPLLDRAVVEFAISIPPSLYRQGGTRRWIFREMMRGILPETVRLQEGKQETHRVAQLLAAKRRVELTALQHLRAGWRPPRAVFADIDLLIAQLERGHSVDVGPDYFRPFNALAFLGLPGGTARGL